MDGTGTRRTGSELEIPDALVASQVKYYGDRGRAWIAGLSRLATDRLEHWGLRLDGTPVCGAVALVLPVLLADDTPAVLKLQPIDEETAGEPVALRVWRGDRAVRLLRHDPSSGSMLLERLDASRSLRAVPDDLAALQILSEILTRLNAVPAPPGIRQLADAAAALPDRVSSALARLPDLGERRRIRRYADAVRDVLPEPGDRLLHWDLHYANVLARFGPEPTDPRGSWLAIDPKPIAGDPGFELLPALHNRWGDVIATGDVPRAVRRRFDLMTEVLGLDRQRAAGWTVARVLRGVLWELEHADTSWHAEPDRAIAEVLLDIHR